jgi:hypothetical protein
MSTTARPVETREQALRRLLQVARESGVELKRDAHGDLWATSVSEPGRLYPVTPDSCGCRGYQMHRHCRHVAALWAHLGYFDAAPDPEPTALLVPTVCETFRGLGQVETTYQTGPAAFGYLWIGCPTCNGAKIAA